MGAGGPLAKWNTVIKHRLDDIEKWISEGMAEYSICKELGISTSTWYDAKKDYPELSELVLRARANAGSLLLNKQYQAASGQIITLKKQKVLRDGEVIDAEEEMYIPPNVQAAEFWGRHIMPGYVAPRSEGAGSVTVNVQLPQVQAEIAKLADKRKALEQELAAIDIDGEIGDPFTD